jgi:hypothetical protein
MYFEARAYLWMLQCVQGMFIATFFVGGHESSNNSLSLRLPNLADNYAVRPISLIFLEIFITKYKNLFSCSTFLKGLHSNKFS